MIIGERPRIYDAKPFVEGMERALRGVVRVLQGEDSSMSVCTGWLLTPKIVVAPAYALDSAALVNSRRTITVLAPSWKEEILVEPEILGYDGEVSRELRIALLPLQRPHPGHVNLALAPPKVGDSALLLHFPFGKPILSLSVGRLLAINASVLDYDADSQLGSGGGPLFDSNWRLIAVHIQGERSQRNRGINRVLLLEMLQRSNSWQQIAHYQQFADVLAGEKRLREDIKPDPTKMGDSLLTAALSARFDPNELPPEIRNRLRESVVDPTEKQWTLQTSVRQSALRSVGTVEELRQRLPRKRTKDTAQRVIDRIVKGPPFDLSRVDDDSLSWWIQASRWFAGVVPSLPSSGDITRELERRRIRSRLDSLAGPGFSGRKKELETMKLWFDREPTDPLTISGIGGVGKSALVAKFVSDLPAETIIFWLDFDRADLSADDAVSVIAALGEQACTQLENFELPPVDGSDWANGARKFGQRLREEVRPGPNPVLVLDSFEVAQYSERYHELWLVLETIVTELPSIRVIVSGRAPIEKLRLGGRAAESFVVDGLRAGEVRAWLRRHGVDNPKVTRSLVKIARGIPLIIRLAFQLVQAGERIDNLPKRLPLEIVPGYLYRRILRRVQKPEFREVAKAALVLRRLTAEMVRPVLGGLINLPLDEVSKWFAQLSRETALVTGTDVLRLRREVRSAALRLLEQDNPKLIRSIEERAEKWYEQQDTDDPEVAAELVYHRLRLGNLKGAEHAWRDGCGIHLQDGLDNLKPRAKAWLKARLGDATTTEAIGRSKELVTADQIRELRSRGLDRGVNNLLGSVGRLNPDSPLLFHEAFEVRAAGQGEIALKALIEAAPSGRPEARDRAVLRALLHSESGQPRLAYETLGVVDGLEHWRDRTNGRMEALAVKAARIRLNTNLDAEIRAIQSTTFKSPELLCAIDIILTNLQAKLSRLIDEFALGIEIPQDELALAGFAAKVLALRTPMMSFDPDSPLPTEYDRELAKGLTEIASERWKLVTGSMFLAEVSRLVNERSVSSDGLFAGVLGSFALFGGNMGGVSLLGDIVGPGSVASIQTILSSPWDSRQQQFLQEGLGMLDLPIAREYRAKYLRPLDRRLAIALYILSPDPLEMLTNVIAGRPARAV